MKLMLNALKKSLIKGICKNYYLNMCIYRLLLDICFIRYVSVIFLRSTYGNYYTQGELRPELYMISWLIFWSSLIFSKKWFDDGRASSIILIFLYYVCCVPFTSMMGYGCFNFYFSALNVIYWMCLFLFSRLLRGYPAAGKAQESRASNFFVFFVILVAVISTLYFGSKSHFRIDLDLSNAYNYRFSEEAVKTYGFEPYLIGLSRIIIPTGITYAVINKKWILSIGLILCSVLNYSYDGGKTILFISAASVFVGFFYQSNFKKTIPPLLNLLILGGFAEYEILGSDIVIRILIRRLFFIPNLINSAYYDYMRHQPPNLFSHLLRFLGIPSSGSISNVIGSVYFKADYMSANTGTVGDALWQFKGMGVIVMPIMIVALLGLLDWASKKVPEQYLIIPCLVFAYYINNSCFTTALFTHGLVPFVLLLILYHRRKRRTVYVWR